MYPQLNEIDRLGYLHSVNVGKAKPLRIDGRRMMSGIGKLASKGKVNVKRLGIEGDEQVEFSIHGGLDKAVYAYPIEHYAFWKEQRKFHGVSMFDEDLPAGFVGENLTISGLLEHEIYVGDKLHFPSCLMRVSEPREPCSKFNAVMGYNLAAKDMVQNGCCGFYLVVEVAGSIEAGQTFSLRPGRRILSISKALEAKWAKHAD